MKIGVISDVHSNVVALKAVIDYMEAEGCEEYLFLGDYVSDTPYTRDTLDYLYEFIDTHTCQLLRGNREEYMLNHRKAVLENGLKKSMPTICFAVTLITLENIHMVTNIISILAVRELQSMMQDWLSALFWKISLLMVKRSGNLHF